MLHGFAFAGASDPTVRTTTTTTTTSFGQGRAAECPPRPPNGLSNGPMVRVKLEAAVSQWPSLGGDWRSNMWATHTVHAQAGLALAGWLAASHPNGAPSLRCFLLYIPSSSTHSTNTHPTTTNTPTTTTPTRHTILPPPLPCGIAHRIPSPFLPPSPPSPSPSSRSTLLRPYIPHIFPLTSQTLL